MALTRTGFRKQSYDEIIEKKRKATERAVLRKKERDATKPNKAVKKRTTRQKTGNKKTPKTQRAKKMQKKKLLIEKYNLPSIKHTRWGTGKNPTDTDILRGMLWTVFSFHIRTRDKDKPCISCGKNKDLKQAGHFIPVGGSSVSLWFDEKNVHGECEFCNAFDSFHIVPMRKNLIRLYGERTVENLEQRRHEVVKYGDDWYIEKIKYYHNL